MGKCIVCGCETDDLRCHVREENGKKYDDYQCEECTIKIVKRERKKYEKRFDKKVLPYLLENNFKVVVTHCTDKGETEIIEEFPIKDNDLMYCVDIIRDRMKKRNYEEKWIDIHWEEYNGIDFEIVEYLYFELSNKENGLWECYYFELIGDNGLKLKESF